MALPVVVRCMLAGVPKDGLASSGEMHVCMAFLCLLLVGATKSNMNVGLHSHCKMLISLYEFMRDE
jgi:hypothetical protein